MSATRNRPDDSYWSPRPWMSYNDLLRDFGLEPARKSTPGFRDAVAEQVAALTEGFDGKGGEELPQPERDLTAYRDAIASAQANCPHENAVELLWGKAYTCDDCGRSLKGDLPEPCYVTGERHPSSRGHEDMRGQDPAKSSGIGPDSP